MSDFDLFAALPRLWPLAPRLKAALATGERITNDPRAAALLALLQKIMNDPQTAKEAAFIKEMLADPAVKDAAAVLLQTAAIIRAGQLGDGAADDRGGIEGQ